MSACIKAADLIHEVSPHNISVYILGLHTLFCVIEYKSTDCQEDD